MAPSMGAEDFAYMLEKKHEILLSEKLSSLTENY